LFQNDKLSPGVSVSSSAVEAHVVNADDTLKVPSNAQSLDVGSDSSCQNELTITNETLASRPMLTEVDRSSVLSPRPPEQSAASAVKTGDTQSTFESGVSGLSSQENSVTRTRSRDVMDFAHLKMKLVQLTGPSKEAAGQGTAAAKTKPETDEAKDMSVDTAAVVPSAALNAAANSESQVSVGRAMTGQQVLAGTQELDIPTASQRGPSVSPDPSSAAAQAASQQASLLELPATAVTQRDSSIQPAVPAAAQTSDGEHAAAPVQPVKPVPVYPVTVAHPVPQQMFAVGPGGQLNGSTAVQHLPTGVHAADVQAAMLHQHYQMASPMPAAVDSTAGFVPVQPSVVADMSAASTPASPDSINPVIAPPQPTAADYSQASLLALYNQMMMPLPLLAPTWPALNLNQFLVAANPLLAAQMMYAAPLMPPMSDVAGQMPASDAHLGIHSCQEHQQLVMPSGLSVDHRNQAVRPTAGAVPLAAMPSSGMPLTSMMMPGVGATRPLTPRLPVPPSGHEQQSVVHSAGLQRKKPDRPPHLANLEQALIAKLHGARKPMAHSPAGHSVPGAVPWFQVPYGHHTQTTHSQSPVVSPSFVTDAQLQPSNSTLVADVAASVSASTPLPGTATSMVTAAESVPATGKPATLSSTHKTNEPVEAVHATSASDKPAVTSVSTGQPSSRKLQFTVSAVKDDPLAVKESTAVCEALNVASDSVSQNPPQNATSAQHYTSVSSGLQEVAPASTSKGPVRKGRFRVSDVQEDTDTGASSSQLESSSLPPETGLMSGTSTDSAHNSVTTAAVMAPELCAQQVSSAVVL